MVSALRKLLGYQVGTAIGKDDKKEIEEPPRTHNEDNRCEK